MLRITAFIPLIFLITNLTAQPQEGVASGYDLTRDPVLYTVGYAHLDTEWRWDYEETVNKYLKATLDDNFMRFEKYRPYVFTFSGARRYRMMKEYYPERYEKLKKYIAAGRWFVGGSSVDECDVNIPSPESVIRQVLYGNQYFRKEFGKESVDFMLPDCFGFQAHLPSVLAHAGVKGFSTQKLSWGSATGIPFNLGWWKGLNGEGLLASLNATDYTGRISKGLDTATYWVNRVEENGKKYGVFADYRYYGVGDVGGAPREEDIRNAIAAMNNPSRKIHVLLTSSDQIFRDLTPELTAKLPSYTGDLLLTEHSAGSLTSQAAMKQWNRKNEQLAQAAEPVAVMADWLQGMKYPAGRLYEAWWLVLGSQMHDILPGTSIPQAYNYAWNDEVLALNQFAATLEDAAGVVIRALDTRVKGQCIVVFNPLSNPRNGLAEAEVIFPDDSPEAIRVLDPAGKEIPHQILSRDKKSMHILFPVSMDAYGFSCFDIQEAEKATLYRTDLTAGKNVLENNQMKVTLNADGDISGIISKSIGKEMLAAPAGLILLKEHPNHWPAWNMDWHDRRQPEITRVKGPATFTLTEAGPLRATYRIERNSRNSTFVQFVQLASGQEALQLHTIVYWQSAGVSLKANFPLKASAPSATYNLGCGTIERGNNNEKKFEVPSREWFDLTDKSGTFGVTIMEDSKFGSDKPDDNTLRLTLLYTPKTNIYHDQATQDWGVHKFTYAIYPHKGDWRAGQSEWKARALNQPLRVFQAMQHMGILGKSFSFCSVSTPQAEIRSMKKAENGSGVILRLQELWGRQTGNFTLTFPAKIRSVWETDGQERPLRQVDFTGKMIPLDLSPYGLITLLVEIDTLAGPMTPVSSIELPIPYDTDVVAGAAKKTDGRFGKEGWTYPAELFPDRMTVGGVTFKMGRKNDGQKNAVVCNGQRILLPKTGNFNKLYLLAAAETDTTGTFKTSAGKTTLRIQRFNGMIGQSYNRTWDNLSRISGLEPGFIKPDEVAWFATHMYHDTLTLPHRYGYIFLYSLDAGPGAAYLQLPENPSIHIFAISVAANPYDALRPASPLYDDPAGDEPMTLQLPVSYTSDKDKIQVEVSHIRKRTLAELPARITMKDYADLHQPNGVVTRFYHNTPDTTFRQIEDGMSLTALTDGMFILLPGDSLHDLWAGEGEGRILIDLQKEVRIDSLHLFVSATTDRGPQAFSIWTTAGNKPPEPKSDPRSKGWQYQGYVAPIDVWSSGPVLYKILPAQGHKLQQRYILLVSEPTGTGFGPYYFREIDLFESQQ